ncbi:hypothetical protein V1511DRAFT_502422, partial [Dipodascopsis uninucleata]
MSQTANRRGQLVIVAGKAVRLSGVDQNQRTYCLARIGSAIARTDISPSNNICRGASPIWDEELWFDVPIIDTNSPSNLKSSIEQSDTSSLLATDEHLKAATESLIATEESVTLYVAVFAVSEDGSSSKAVGTAAVNLAKVLTRYPTIGTHDAWIDLVAPPLDPRDGNSATNDNKESLKKENKKGKMERLKAIASVKGPAVQPEAPQPITRSKPGEITGRAYLELTFYPDQPTKPGKPAIRPPVQPVPPPALPKKLPSTVSNQQFSDPYQRPPSATPTPPPHRIDVSEVLKQIPNYDANNPPELPPKGRRRQHAQLHYSSSHQPVHHGQKEVQYMPAVQGSQLPQTHYGNYYHPGTVQFESDFYATERYFNDGAYLSYMSGMNEDYRDSSSSHDFRSDGWNDYSQGVFHGLIREDLNSYAYYDGHQSAQQCTARNHELPPIPVQAPSKQQGESKISIPPVPVVSIATDANTLYSMNAIPSYHRSSWDPYSVQENQAISSQYSQSVQTPYRYIPSSVRNSSYLQQAAGDMASLSLDNDDLMPPIPEMKLYSRRPLSQPISLSQSPSQPSASPTASSSVLSPLSISANVVPAKVSGRTSLKVKKVRRKSLPSQSLSANNPQGEEAVEQDVNKRSSVSSIPSIPSPFYSAKSIPLHPAIADKVGIRVRPSGVRIPSTTSDDGRLKTNAPELTPQLAEALRQSLSSSPKLSEAESLAQTALKKALAAREAAHNQWIQYEQSQFQKRLNQRDSMIADQNAPSIPPKIPIDISKDEWQALGG